MTPTRRTVLRTATALLPLWLMSSRPVPRAAAADAPPATSPSTLPAPPPASQPAALTERQREQLAEVNKLEVKLIQLYGERKYADAIPIARQIAELRLQAFGEQPPEYANSLNFVASLYQVTGDYAGAEPFFRQALEVRGRALGEGHPAYATNLGDLALLYKSMGDYAKAEPLYRQAADIQKKILGEEHPAYATSLNSLASLYESQGDYAKAEPLYRQALEIRKKALGEAHPDYATSLNGLGALYASMGEYAKAEPLYRQAADIQKKVLGEGHPAYAVSLNNLAGLYDVMGEYAKAQPLYIQTAEIFRKLLGEGHPVYATSLNNLAKLYSSMGDYAKAEPLYRQALEIRRKALGEGHPAYATSLNNLAALYESMGDYAKAEPLFRQSLEIRRKTLGEAHPDYATSLNNLAEVYDSMGDYARAEPLCRQAMEIRKKALGEGHPDYAASLDNLAMLYEEMGDYAKAEPLCRSAMEIRRKALGEGHPSYATGLNNLASLYELMGDRARAEPLCLQAMEIREKVLGEGHSDYAASLNNLAVLYEARGDTRAAADLCGRALSITARNLEISAAVQSERQQLSMLEKGRSRLGAYLSFSAAAGVSPGEAYAQALGWKGAVSLRQGQMRALRRASEGESLSPEQRGRAARASAALQQATARLAALTLSTPDARATPGAGRPEERRAETGRLSEEVEGLQRELASISGAYRRQLKQEQRTPEDLKKALPAGAALVDVLEYTHIAPPATGKGPVDWEQRLVAFVVRPGQEVARIELGPAKPVEQAVGRWRATFGAGRGGEDAGQELRRLVWLPLEKAVEGADAVLVSPDGPLCRLPLGALPGSEPGHYLIEEVGVAVVPVPQALAQLLADGPAPGADVAAGATMLLMGDVNYGASAPAATQAGPATAPNYAATLPAEAPAGRAGGLAAADLPHRSRSAARGPGWGRWEELQATRHEIATIRDSFEQAWPEGGVKLLRGTGATLPALCRQAPACRYLHLATHGFFAPGAVKSALDVAAGPAGGARGGIGPFGRRGVSGFHPGLLSGIVLAGANLPPGRGPDDGILTALEVEELDLSRVDLAVLSACETGLGDSAGGEGLLGLQRAFQVAGARSVVASLWQVPDLATRDLMVSFYENLWQKKMGKLAALRQAQLSLLRCGRDRGLQYIPDDGANAGGRGEARRALTDTGRLPPQCWAAFVLSGDWR